MKGVIVLCVVLCAGGKFIRTKTTYVCNQSHHYVASLAAPFVQPSHRWILVPDGEGRMHLMDLNPIDFEPEPAFNPNDDVFFILFTRRNPTVGQRLLQTTASISGSQWSNAAPGTRVSFVNI